MKTETVFNKRIQEFLDEGSEGNNAQLINSIINLKPNYKNLSYYTVLDDFCLKLGLGFFEQKIIDNKDKVLGYVPSFKYYNNNLLREFPREEPINSNTPIPLSNAFKTMAKEVVYRLRRVSNLRELMENI